MFPHSAIRNAFHRCLDLYMCPRQMKNRMNIDPDKLLPKLPKPRDLRPFPTAISLFFRGHTDVIRSVDLSPDGQFLISGGDDRTARVWDVQTGRCLQSWPFDSTVNRVAWNPNSTINVVAIALEKGFYLMAPSVGTPEQDVRTAALFVEPEKRGSGWKIYSAGTEWFDRGYRVYNKSPSEVDSVSWHRKGDYFLTHSTKGKMCFIHRLTVKSIFD
jgi:ribosome biogenesis protein ERB1